MTRPLLVLAAFVLLAPAAPSAWAKPRVALTQIEGDDTGDVQDAVIEALDGRELSIVSGKEVNRAADKLGELADFKEREMKKLAGELEADAVVLGKLGRDKATRKTTLKFRIYIHRKLTSFTLAFSNAKSDKFRAAVRGRMFEKLGVKPGQADAGEEAEPAVASGKKKKGADAEAEAEAEPPRRDKKGKKVKVAAEAEEPEAEARPHKKGAAEPEAEPARGKKRVSEAEEPRAKKGRGDGEPAAASPDEEAGRAKKGAEASEPEAAAGEGGGEAAPAPRAEEGEAGEEAEEADRAPRRKTKKKLAAREESDELEAGVATVAEPARTPNRAALRVDIGPSAVMHTLKFNTKAFDNQPKGVSLSPVPGVRIAAEVYPLALSNPAGAAAGLGIAVEYDRTLTAKLKAMDEPNVDVPIKRSHISAGLRYRLALGASPTSPTVTFGVGYGKRSFSTDGSKLTVDAARAAIARDAPSTSYTVLDPGVAVRLPLGSRFAFAFGGRGLVVTDTGPIGKLGSYGRAKVYGFEGSAALDVLFGARLALQLSGDFAQIGYSFTGAGALSSGLDGDDTNQEVGGLADRAIGFAATLAVLY